MRMQYKKVGDTFTYPEFNALCYLLQHGSWKETFSLNLNKKTNGQYANYTLQDTNKILSETRDGFVIVKNIKTMKKANRLIYIKINHENLHSHLDVLLHAVHVTHIDQQVQGTDFEGDTIDVTIQKEDFKEEIGTKNEEIIAYNSSDIQPLHEDILISMSVNLDGGGEAVVSFDPVAYGLTKGDWIKSEGNIKLYYTEHEINFADGELPDEDEIICENFSELQRVINSAPTGSTTKIKLNGTKYTFTNQITISNKNIIIHGGNLNTGKVPFTELDANNIGRHFIVKYNASLTITNCQLINGNVYGEKGRYSLHNRGGSIYIDAQYVQSGNHFMMKGGKVSCTHCWFMNNTAMLGGAIYNAMGKLEASHCMFDGNKAIQEDRSKTENTYYYNLNNWGGAIFSETSEGDFYNDSTDKLHIAPSTYTYNSDTKTTTLELYFYKQQNTLLLEKETITKNNLQLFDYTDKEWVTITDLKITSQTSNINLSNLYTITLEGTLTNAHKYYFRFVGNSANPNIISHIVTANGGNLK